jgi:hypothetical protein
VDIAKANDEFGIDGILHICAGNGGFPLITIDNEHARAEICAYAGQVLSYRPRAKRRSAVRQPTGQFSARQGHQGRHTGLLALVRCRTPRPVTGPTTALFAPANGRCCSPSP